MEDSEAFWYFSAHEKYRTTKEEVLRGRLGVSTRNPGSFVPQDDGYNGARCLDFSFSAKASKDSLDMTETGKQIPKEPEEKKFFLTFFPYR